MKRRSVNGWTHLPATIATPALGIERSILSARRASDSIDTEHCIVRSSPCHLACTNLPSNDRDKSKTGDRPWSCCSRRPVSSHVVIFLNIAADGGDGADENAGNVADAGETTPTTWTTNTPIERTVSSAPPILTLATTVECYKCDLYKLSIRKG